MAAMSHPCVDYGGSRGWDYARNAKFFRVPYSGYKKMVRGFTGCSFSRANLFEKRSRGEIQALDVLRWHERHRRVPSGPRVGA